MKPVCSSRSSHQANSRDRRQSSMLQPPCSLRGTAFAKAHASFARFGPPSVGSHGSAFLAKAAKRTPQLRRTRTWTRPAVPRRRLRPPRSRETLCPAQRSKSPGYAGQARPVEAGDFPQTNVSKCSKQGLALEGRQPIEGRRERVKETIWAHDHVPKYGVSQSRPRALPLHQAVRRPTTGWPPPVQEHDWPM